MDREMKDSGVEWIGEIPEDWEINTVFQLFTQVRNKNVDMREKNLLSLSYGKIKRKSINIVGGLLPESFISSVKLYGGTFVRLYGGDIAAR